jgi:hypothetical protein
MTRLPMTEAAIMEVQRIKNILPLGVPHGTVQVRNCAIVSAQSDLGCGGSIDGTGRVYFHQSEQIIHLSPLLHL